ncbi:hypothetical protein [Cupriavidus metallidurans]|uniref:hypothetical protein n=1 Tax=Cupriavidus metallidurans TaxID=119219 RepID=UPI003D043F5C
MADDDANPILAALRAAEADYVSLRNTVLELAENFGVTPQKLVNVLRSRVRRAAGAYLPVHGEPIPYDGLALDRLLRHVAATGEVETITDEDGTHDPDRVGWRRADLVAALRNDPHPIYVDESLRRVLAEPSPSEDAADDLETLRRKLRTAEAEVADLRLTVTDRTRERDEAREKIPSNPGRYDDLIEWTKRRYYGPLFVESNLDTWPALKEVIKAIQEQWTAINGKDAERLSAKHAEAIDICARPRERPKGGKS